MMLFPGVKKYFLFRSTIWSDQGTSKSKQKRFAINDSSLKITEKSRQLPLLPLVMIFDHYYSYFKAIYLLKKAKNLVRNQFRISWYEFWSYSNDSVRLFYTILLCDLLW